MTGDTTSEKILWSQFFGNSAFIQKNRLREFVFIFKSKQISAQSALLCSKRPWLISRSIGKNDSVLSKNSNVKKLKKSKLWFVSKCSQIPFHIRLVELYSKQPIGEGKQMSFQFYIWLCSAMYESWDLRCMHQECFYVKSIYLTYFVVLQEFECLKSCSLFSWNQYQRVKNCQIICSIWTFPWNRLLISWKFQLNFWLSSFNRKNEKFRYLFWIWNWWWF